MMISYYENKIEEGKKVEEEAEGKKEDNIIYKEVETNNISFSYYPYYIFNKIHSNLRYYNVLENNFDANEVIEGIYIGAIGSSYNIEELKKYGITHIISVIAGYVPPYPDKFKYMVINALDDNNTNILKCFDDANNFIDDAFENNGKVLIHCVFGRSRSATILASYMIKSYGMLPHHVIDVIRTKRQIIEPNEYFRQQLLLYYNNLYSLVL